MAAWLCPEAVAAPGERTRLHLGHPAQEIGSTGYCSAFTVRDARRFTPSASARTLPVVFLVNACSALPSLALALQDAGLAAIVAEDTCSDAHLVQCHGFALENGWSAHIRLGELLHTDGTVGIAANIAVARAPGGASDASLDAALALARDFAPPPTVRERPPAIAMPVPESDYAAMTYPPLEYRLLALFRLHTAIGYFFPYKDLLDGDWDALLPAFIPRFEAAADALEYNLAIAELLIATSDYRAGASSPA